MEMAAWEALIRSTAFHAFIRANEPWLWPLCEVLHYLGLSVLLGTVGLSICVSSAWRGLFHSAPSIGCSRGSEAMC
jgi:hypothetical protein